MKSKNKIIYRGVLVTLLSIVSVFGMLGCENKANDKAGANEQDTPPESEQVTDYNRDNKSVVERFKEETNEKIEANKLIIDDLKAKVSNLNGEAKVSYEKKIVQLERKNAEMQIRLDDYKSDGSYHWESFKSEFTHDMNELGSALSDLVKNNVE